MCDVKNRRAHRIDVKKEKRRCGKRKKTHRIDVKKEKRRVYCEE